MNNEPKYYTPTIEEFHVGFEYEVRNELGKDEWSTYLFDDKFLQLYYPEEWNNINSEIQNDNIRVKYLDKEDIESLGWKYKEPDGSHYDKCVTSYNIDDIYFIFPYDDNIFIKDSNGLVLFYGNIKNKSELKRLMKQLKIQWKQKM